MPFRYQLQKVLDIFERRKKALDAEVLQKTRLLNEEKDKLNEVSTRRTAAQKGLSAQMSAGATADVAASNDYIQLLNQRIEVQSRSVKAAEASLKEVEARRTELQKEMKKFEKHKELKLAEFEAEQKKKEAKRIDEMAGTIYMKKRIAAAEADEEELARLERIEKLKLLRQMQEKRDSRW